MVTANLDRLPPHDLAAEQSVLGSILIDRDAIIAVAPTLRKEDFYQPSNGEIYDTVFKLYERQEPTDLLTLSSELERNGVLDKVGGYDYLSGLANSVPTAAHAEHYATIVQRTASLRRLIEAGAAIVGIGYEQGAEVEDAIDRAEGALFRVVDQSIKRDFVPIAHALDTYFDELGTLQNTRGDVTGVPTGFHSLDKITGGLQKSDLIVLAARPSVGKTALALSIAAYAALEGRRTVGVFSLEMSNDQVIARMISARSGVNSGTLRSGRLSDSDWTNASRAFGKLAEARMFLDDSPGISVIDVRTRARRLKAEHGLDLLVIDYLQLMRGRRTENRVQEISEISRGLKLLARELEIPVLALSQMSRAVEGRSDHSPMLSDLRESGSIEQDADIVMFLHNENRYKKDDEIKPEDKGKVELILAKHRNGSLGRINLRFYEPIAFFVDFPSGADAD